MLQNDRELLERIIEFPHNKRESHLSEILVSLGELSVNQILNDVGNITRDEVSTYAQANFDFLDRRPNPRDNMLSDHELADAIERTKNIREQTILTYMWLHFDEIRCACNDCAPEEAAFDNHLTRQDVANFRNC